MAGGGGWLAFCILARHVAVMVKGLFILVLAAEAQGACKARVGLPSDPAPADRGKGRRHREDTKCTKAHFISQYSRARQSCNPAVG